MKWLNGVEAGNGCIGATRKTYLINVTSCPCYERYRYLGLEEFGTELSCCREKYFAKGFNPNLSLMR